MAARIQVQREARRGEIVEVRILIQHPMETGFRYDALGRQTPRNVIYSFECRYGGIEVFRAAMGPRERKSAAPNPIATTQTSTATTDGLLAGPAHQLHHLHRHLQVDPHAHHLPRPLDPGLGRHEGRQGRLGDRQGRRAPSGYGDPAELILRRAVSRPGVQRP